MTTSAPTLTTLTPVMAALPAAPATIERIIGLRVSQTRTTQTALLTLQGPNGLRDVRWHTLQTHIPFAIGDLVLASALAAPPDTEGTSLANSRMAHCQPPLVRLRRVSAPCPSVNLLHTSPAHWRLDAIQPWGKTFTALWQSLSAAMRAWFNAVFWQYPSRWHRFLVVPGSLKHHHNRRHGLFMHSIDCALRIQWAAVHDARVDQDVLLMAALLHDVGKAEEYDWDRHGRCWRLSTRGQLIGHRLSTLEWLAAARTTLSTHEAPSEAQAMAVYHAINACHAPDWVGLRAPRTAEAFYLASVDALSGHCDRLRTFHP